MIERKDQRTEDTWDLSLLAKDAASWERDLKKLERAFRKAESFKGTLGRSSDDLYKALVYLRDTEMEAERLGSWAFLMYEADSSDSTVQRHYMMYQNAASLFSEKISYFTPELLAIDESKLKNRDLTGVPTYYALFPVLPLILVIFFWACFKHAKVGLVEITVFCFALAFICELIRKGGLKQGMKDANLFFKGMGEGFSQVVVLIVAASTMVAGLRAMGMIDMISNSISGVENASAGLMFAFSGITALITFISGSGNAVFYSFIELIPSIAQNAGIDPIMVALPMQCTSNLIRSVSPVAAVIIIVAASVRTNPLEVVKRTSVPILAGYAAVLVISFIRYI